MDENEIKLENSVSEMPPDNNKNRTSTSIIITVAVCFVVMMSVIFGMIHYYNAKELKKDAISRVNTICDEINSYTTEIDESKLYTLDEKLKEVNTIIEENNLDNVYVDKYLYSKNYVNDIRLYNEIVSDVMSVYEEDYKDVQSNINALKTDSIRAKITDTMLTDIKETVRMKVLHNTLKYFEEYLNKKHNFSSVSGIIQSYHYSVPPGIDKNFLLSIPDGQKIDSVAIEGFGSITKDNATFEKSYYADYVNTLKSISAKPIQDAINKNADGGFAIEYVSEGLEDMISCCVSPFEIEVIYENGVLDIYMTTNNGKESIFMNQLNSVKAITLS